MINPGALRHLVTIEGPTRSEDDEGGFTESYGEVAQAWAEIEPLSGREQLEAMQTQAGASHRIRMWYRTDITPDMRVTYGSRVFTIVAPPFNPGERGELTELMVLENVQPYVAVES